MKIKNTLLVRFLISLMLGAPSYLFFATIRNFPLSSITTYAYVQYSGLVTAAFFLLFQGHYLKSMRLEKSIAWKENFNKRLIIESLIAFFYPIPIVICFYSFLYLVLWKMPLYVPSIVLYCGFLVFISFLFMGFVNVNSIIEDWRKSLIKTEILEKENIRAKLEALQTQLSPHFLFNNFNIIDALIETQPALARKYVQGLSSVFRYILENKNRELVELKDELQFIQGYMFLMETRFEKNVSLEIIIKNTSVNKMIPPVSLQLLIENAIKHNEISKRHKLKIVIQELDNNYLSITNNMKLRKGMFSGTGNGLKNIARRYEYLTEKEVIVNTSENSFEILIPLLQITSTDLV